MYEVEVKVPTDHAAVRARLSDVDADALGTVVQRDTYYDAPHRRFAETDEALRIRRTEAENGDRETHVTYKGPLVDSASKTRREHETGVDDGETMDSILRALGFEPAAVVEKERARFRVGEYTVTLDDVTDVGTFVEVETDAADVDAAREGAFELLETIGLDPDDQIRTSYLGLLLDGADDGARVTADRAPSSGDS
ncbi:class IV adenylate cyclase [Salinigranum rubrum]|uniref:Class IV adenylate cyclase n=1 Tax=Salinigranum rubrum TaxID=755307 RepID=A0A2I8VJA0_9EURY|nr:class IV adenylate cyclase [Salinigranum rubrum]AUV81974.1 class IV adenylate cyclase [Salinigranum rubrum]